MLPLTHTHPTHTRTYVHAHTHTRAHARAHARAESAEGVQAPLTTEIENEFVSVAFDGVTGRMVWMKNKEDGLVIAMDQVQCMSVSLSLARSLSRSLARSLSLSRSRARYHFLSRALSRARSLVLSRHVEYGVNEKQGG